MERSAVDIKVEEMIKRKHPDLFEMVSKIEEKHTKIILKKNKQEVKDESVD